LLEKEKPKSLGGKSLGLANFGGSSFDTYMAVDEKDFVFTFNFDECEDKMSYVKLLEVLKGEVSFSGNISMLSLK
jgi:hypothetical protein